MTARHLARESSACGVGFVVSLEGQPTHQNVQLGLTGLCNLEHRGGLSADLATSDGAGIMTDIPHELLGVSPGDAVANLFLPRNSTARIRALKIFEETFTSVGLPIYSYRDVPVNRGVLSEQNRANCPKLLMAFIKRPDYCTTRYNFEKMLYQAKQLTRSRLRENGNINEFVFASLSAGTIVYKALTPSSELASFYLDLNNPRFVSRFSLFHRRFSTNTATTWDTAQPFRTVAHNGEINTISGNRAWAYARERALGLREDELLTHRGISDSGSVNEMIEALTYRSSIPHLDDILAILMPRAGKSENGFYPFWSRAMEAWDGPALFVFCEGRRIGARLDRSGFRPCRWARTGTHFYLSSEAGSFQLDETKVLAKGFLSGGGSVTIELHNGRIELGDTSEAKENAEAHFDPRVKTLEYQPPPPSLEPDWSRLARFGFTKEDFDKMLVPMVKTGKEPIGSMGDTARLSVLSSVPRSLFDHFYQNFAQVTNPPMDYLREDTVLDTRVLLGRKPNIFEPKEFLPLKQGISLSNPILSLGQMEFLKGLDKGSANGEPWPSTQVFDATFPVEQGIDGLNQTLDRIGAEILTAIRNRVDVFILSDRLVSDARVGVPMPLLVSDVIQRVNAVGMRLRTSLALETGEVRNSHDLSVLIGLGAAAICPYLLLEAACEHPSCVGDSTATVRESNVIGAMKTGLLRIMAKMGVSVLRSYHGAQLFTILGLSQEVHDRFFPEHDSRLGGYTLRQIIQARLNTEKPGDDSAPELPNRYLYREHPKGLIGEKHSITIARSKWIHKLIKDNNLSLEDSQLYREYLQSVEQVEPISIRHLLKAKPLNKKLGLDKVEESSEILKTFGSGAMSFGAISAEAQRDIFLAMNEIGGRSNSGEGGENPYFFTEGISATTKQVASGRFGVTAQYLVTGEEIQIKIAQGAKPGEGGQLMGLKVSVEIARARHAEPGTDLISPPPMHDIYSIEDLKQLIYELKQLKPDGKISVKLVAGDNIGTIAVGVAKAGADIIHVAGHDGGTGAAALLSMKHTGLPWELGLIEVHRALVEQSIRDQVILRVDGGLLTGQDIIFAALMGAEQYDFGKLLLVAEGCIMARVCEKNTCPTGIATHDPKFKRLYRGNKDKIVTMMKILAEDVRIRLADLGVVSLQQLVGRTDYLVPNEKHGELIAEHGLDLRYFCQGGGPMQTKRSNPFSPAVSRLNEELLEKQSDEPYAIRCEDRAVPATLVGQRVLKSEDKPQALKFKGSAGQGFGVFLSEGLSIRLEGEANDSVAKSMSGGSVVVVPPREAGFNPAQNTIIGNCALYGATGGVLYVYGKAGDRFAVRNSGAHSIVESVGMHACEYMTGGCVVILNAAGPNIGAGMTGGQIYVPRKVLSNLNMQYLAWAALEKADQQLLKAMLEAYVKETQSLTAKEDLAQWEKNWDRFIKVHPIGKSAQSKSVVDKLVVSVPQLRHALIDLHGANASV